MGDTPDEAVRGVVFARLLLQAAPVSAAGEGRGDSDAPRSALGTSPSTF